MSGLETKAVFDAAGPLPFTSRRSAVYGTRGVAASSQPLATEAGIRILQQGGNAADAAVAMAACLNVTEPCSTGKQASLVVTFYHHHHHHHHLIIIIIPTIPNPPPGIGGDAFALFYSASSRRVESVLGNGRSPAALTMEMVRERGYEGGIPKFHGMSVTVPGAAAAWVDIVERFGKLSLAQVLQPAIELAENGYPVGPTTAVHWQLGVDQLKQGGPHFNDMLLDGRAPRAGQVIRMPKLAETFRTLAREGKDGFYKGRIAEAIVEAVKARGGVMEMSDLAEHTNEIGQPICTRYRGVDIWEVPPPTQGLAALLALNIFEACEGTDKPSVQAGHDSPEYFHTAIESMRLSFGDALHHIACPQSVPHVPIKGLLSKDYAAERAKHIEPNRCCKVQAGSPVSAGGDTVYFCVIDGEGNGMSMINSNYMGFGSGIIPEGCGFSLQNRGQNFSLDPNHANALGPKKRPYHTIIPGLATTAGGDLHSTFGVMGGFMQPQGHMQVVINMLDFGMDPQAALDAPRFCVRGPGETGHHAGEVELSRVYLELHPGTPIIAERLVVLGHDVELLSDHYRAHQFGRGQIITRDPETGVLCGGSDPRADGLAIAW
eukprot:jgi/Chlat1/472/Chrsp103S01073